MAHELVDRPLVLLTPEPQTVAFGMETVSWKGIPITLLSYPDYPICHGDVEDGELSYGSFWYAEESDRSKTRHSLWFSSNKVPGFVMVADGLRGDSFSINDMYGERKYFSDHWRDCVLANPQTIESFVVSSHWEKASYLKKRPALGEMHFHVTAYLHNGCGLNQLSSLWGPDYKLVTHDKNYTQIVYPPERRYNRTVGMIG